MELLWRETLLPGEQATAAVTSAFQEEGALRMPGGVAESGWRERLALAAGLALELAQTFHERLAVDGWCLACGRTPDELACRPEAAAELAEVLRGASLQEAATVVADLVRTGAARAGVALVPPRVQAARQIRPPLPRPCRVALALDLDAVGRGVQALGARLGSEGELWWADRSLGFRCSLGPEGLALRAHHPVIQDEILTWCAARGHDVERL